jgi:hypothetical protein
MSQVRLSDIVVPEVFASYMSKNTVQTMALYQQGVMRSDADLANKLAGGGRTFNVPFWKDLDDTEADTASDDPDSHSTPAKLTSGTDIARRQIRTKSWSTMNLSAELAGDDPMARIQSRIAAYWARQFDDIAIASVRGVFADNIANDSSDMVNAIHLDTGDAIAAAELFSAEAVMDTAQTLGDAKKDLKLIVMHSVVHNRLAQNDLITFRPDSEGKVWHDYFMDWRVHVSDRTPAVAGTNRTIYHTYMFGADAFGWAEKDVADPVDVDKTPSAGDGMGSETIYTRRQFAVHPYGIKWTDTTVAGEFPSNAELRLAANWDRVYAERKQIPIALLTTNG